MKKPSTKTGKLLGRIGLVILALLLVIQAVTAVGYALFMNKHIHTKQNMRGLPAFESYTTLTREQADLLSTNGDTLNGYFYKAVDAGAPKGVIIINNGFGAGHEGLLGEIDVMAQAGYLVYGFDKTGYDQSGGNGVGAVTQGVRDLLSAAKFVADAPQSKGLPLLVYGKSWGAYCCLAALGQTDKITAAVALSAFNAPKDMLGSEARRMLGSVSSLFEPFLWVCDLVNEDHALTAENSLMHTDAKVLLMHSRDDATVPFASSFAVWQERFAQRENLTFCPMDGKGHNLLTSAQSRAFNDALDEDLQVYAQAHGNTMTEALWQDFLQGYDLKQGLRPDETIMAQILAFMDEATQDAAK